MIVNYKECLEHIKKIYGLGETSALIGAGFSKNLYEDFPNWDELLFKMILDIFENDIERLYSDYKHNNSRKKNKKARDEFERDCAKQLSATHGYLNIVSKYIEKHGYRECVDLYIEEHIPYLDLDKKELIFKAGKNQPIAINADNTLTHEKFLRLTYFNNIFTTNYDNLLEEVAKNISTNWAVVTSSYKLKLSAKEKYIVKIHGHLSNDSTSPNENDFCFDGDHSLRYIISKEDYQNYPLRHEAFMQMMKISLLRESFILFGFSGQDPNFIAWVKWVRDVLIKDPGREKDYSKPEYYKIFLFAYDSNEPSEKEKLFYRNHHILYIPMLNSDIVNTKPSEKPINAVMDFLNETNKEELKLDADNTYCEGPQITELEKENQEGVKTNENEPNKSETNSVLTSNYYGELWGKVLDANNTTIKEDVFNQILDYKRINRFVKLVLRQEQILSQFGNEQNVSEQIAKVLLIASIDVDLPLVQHHLHDYIKEALIQKEHTALLNQYNQRFEVLNNYKCISSLGITNVNYESDYNYLLSLAFSLDFSALKCHLEEWNPSGRWIQNKVMLLNSVNYEIDSRESGRKLLLDYLDSESNPLERFYATTLLNIINRTIPYQYPTAQYENQGLLSLWDLKDYFIGELKKEKKKERFIPYGWTVNTVYFGQENHKILAPTRVLQFMINSGLMVSVNWLNIIDKNDWYLVARSLFEDYPYPILWYSLQCNDDKILKRIGQDFAYSEHLRKQIPQMLDKLFKAYFCDDTPESIKTSILKITQSLFISVPADKWAKYFMRVWKEKYIPDIESSHSSLNIKPFIMAGLPYIVQPTYLNRIISDSLDNISKSSGLIDAIYHIKRTVLTNSTITSKIDKLIKNAKNGNDIGILCNLTHILSQQQIDKIIDTFIEFGNNGTYVSNKIIPAIPYLLKKSSKYEMQKSIIINIIIEHKNMWDNGLFENGHTAAPTAFIMVSKIEQNLELRNDDLLKLYDKLVSSYKELSESSFFKSAEANPFYSLDYTSLLSEMLIFLNKHHSDLEHKNDFVEMKNEISVELHNRRKYVDIEEGLWSSERDSVILAINELTNNININGIEGYASYIDILLNRIILKNETSLYSCMNVAFYYITEHIDILLTSETQTKLLIILNKYKGDVCLELNMDKERVYFNFMNIARVLKDKGVNNEIIDYWIGKKDRFIYLDK